jgi:inositol-pentakisphosphate 2-kinase
VQVPLDAGQEVEMRLGDLDVKSADRAGYWAALERRLIEEGWYAGVERGATPDALRCMLW